MTEFEKKNLNSLDDSFASDLKLHHVSRMCTVLEIVPFLKLFSTAIETNHNRI